MQLLTMDPQLTPYLTFNCKAAEAMRFYQSILGGELTMQAFAEAKMARSPAGNDLIVHAVLKKVGLNFMANDSMPSRRAKFGDNVQMSVGGHDSEKLTKVFDGLADGGGRSTCRWQSSSGGARTAR